MVQIFNLTFTNSILANDSLLVVYISVGVMFLWGVKSTHKTSFFPPSYSLLPREEE